VLYCVLPISKVNLQFSLLQMMLRELGNVASVISIACIYVLGDPFFFSFLFPYFSGSFSVLDREASLSGILAV
jgi:hypothetical protein